MTDNRTTERLMAMLEECGVEHELEHDLYVEWVDARGNDVTAFETSCKHKGDVLIVHVFLTPEQAIAATLGRGECEIETRESWLPAQRYHRCKHCGAFFAVMNASGDIPPCVCPNCGKVVKR